MIVKAWKRLRPGLIVPVELAVAFVALQICLVVLDSPAIEAFPAPFVKKLRYPAREQVFRDEDYSRYQVNSHGLVGPDRSVAGNPYRIAVFGDSFVEAFQVPHAFKFTTLIERQFTPAAAHHGVEVWNFGFSGDNTGNEYARWMHQTGNTRFDLVIFTFNDRDLLENRPQDADGAAGAFLVEQPDHSFRLDYSGIQGGIGAFGKWMKSAFGEFFYAAHSVRLRVEEGLSTRLSDWRGHVGRALGATAAAPDRAPGGKREEVSAAMVESTLRQLLFVQSRIAGSGTPVLLVGLPTAEVMPGSALDGASQRRAAYAALSQALARPEVNFVDTYAVLAGAVRQGLDPYGDWEPGGHLNRLGHRLVAQAILDALQQQATRIATADRNATHAVQ